MIKANYVLQAARISICANYSHYQLIKFDKVHVQSNASHYRRLGAQ